MNKINFLIIGAQKSGTSTLHGWLNQHPDIFFQTPKENAFFANDGLYGKGPSYLNEFYQNYAGEKILGSAYVHLIYFPFVAERIFNYNSNMKMLLVLREPIARAYSAYWYARQNSWEKTNSFELAIQKEPLRLNGSFKEQSELTYISHGYYADQLNRYLTYFDQSQIHIVFFEDLKQKPKEVLNDIFNFLNLSYDVKEINFTQKVNSAAMPKILWLQSFLRSYDSWYRKAFQGLTTPKFRAFVRENITAKVFSWNKKSFEYPTINSDLREKLVEHYKPYNETLGVLTGRDLTPWMG
jgi:hypothetical protein